MKRILALGLSVCFLLALLPTASAARNNLYLRMDVAYEGDYYFAALGQELTVISTLEGGTDEDMKAFAPNVKYTKESTSYEEASGFMWIDIPNGKGTEVKWTPTEEGFYCFSASAKVPSSKKEISSLDSGLPVVLVVDMENKTVVKTADEFIAAITANKHYISVQGDIQLVDMGSVYVSQQSVLEIAEGATLTVSGTELYLGYGRWNMGSTVIVDGNLQINEGAALLTGNYPVDMFVSGRVVGCDAEKIPHIQYVGCNVSPFKEFTGTYIEDKATGITTVIENMDNSTILKVELLDTESTIYKALAAMDEGGVVTAFESSITEYEGEYTLSIPVDAKYNGKEMTVYLVDKTIVGYVEPQELKVVCNNGRVALKVDKNDIVMIKEPVSRFDTTTMLVIAAGGGALLIMLLAVIIPAIARNSKKKKAQKTQDEE